MSITIEVRHLYIDRNSWDKLCPLHAECAISIAQQHPHCAGVCFRYDDVELPDTPEISYRDSHRGLPCHRDYCCLTECSVPFAETNPKVVATTVGHYPVRNA